MILNNYIGLKMKRLISILIIFLAFTQLALSQTREVKVLNNYWKFQKGDFKEASNADFNDSKWESVTVPHDWAIYGPFDKNVDIQKVAIVQNGENVATEKTGRTGALPHIGTAWYRNTFILPKDSKEKKIILLFEGAMSEPHVYLNGKKVGEWAYGYSYFYFDVSQFVQAGENTLSVKLTNKEFASRWYPGAGLYRKVSVIIKNNVSIDQWGQFVTTPFISDAVAKVNIKTKASVENTRLVSTIFDAEGHKLSSEESTVSFGKEFDQNTKVEKPKLWSPETPYLYKAVSQLYVGTELKDEVTTRFGIREIKYEANKGFSLNGKVSKFKGVCLDHDLGPLGTAVNKSALRRQMEILKDLGCNAIRSSHNRPSFVQLELADEIGFLFLAESFDEWVLPKVENGYHRFFDEYAEKDIVNLVHATRNHRSIVIWSSGNEVPDQWGEAGVKRAKWLQEIFHREDPTRPVTVGMDQVKAVMESGFGALLDIPGLNYRVHFYDEAFNKFPQGFILGSETASTVSSRGIYKFPVLQDDKPWVIGEFVWTGFDYLGEPTPYDESWPSRSSYFGINDLAGLPKQLKFKVTGAGTYRAACNGDATSLEMFHKDSMKLFSGKLVVLVKSTTTVGDVKLEVNGAGLKSGKLTLASSK
jgi:beta-galactosidase